MTTIILFFGEGDELWVLSRCWNLPHYLLLHRAVAEAACKTFSAILKANNIYLICNVTYICPKRT
jgi:hypothetical protein